MVKTVGVDIGTGYTFDKTAKTITLLGMPQTLTINQVELIVNKKYNNTNTLIYLFNAQGLGGTISANVITLEYDTSAMANTDDLEIKVNIAAISPSCLNTDYKSPDDFIATYTSSSTITLSNLPFTVIDSSQVRYIKVVASSNTSRTFFNGFDGCTMAINTTTNVITIYGVGTPFASGDVYEVGLSGQQKAYDPTLNVLNSIEQSPIWSRYTDVEPLITPPLAFTTSFADAGPEIDAKGYNWVKFWITLDINQGANARFKILQKHTYAGSEEYPICADKVCFSAPASYIDTLAGVNAQYFELETDADQLFCITVQVDNATPYLQLQIQIGTDGGTDAEIDGLYITKGY